MTPSETPSTTRLAPVGADLWETSVHTPAPGLTTHAYLWTPPSGANVLFYATGTDRDFDELERLGGVAHQYLSHRDEAGPGLAAVRARFGATLHAPAAEAAEIGEFAEPDVLLAERHVDANGVEVIPTPGHSPGSTCYLVPGAGGRRYLFTGDTLYRGGDGTWRAGMVPGVSEPAPLAESLRLLATVVPDVVVSSAFAGDAGVHPVDGGDWPAVVEQALAGLER